jgi:hypothetical protein
VVEKSCGDPPCVEFCVAFLMGSVCSVGVLCKRGCAEPVVRYAAGAILKWVEGSVTPVCPNNPTYYSASP